MNFREHHRWHLVSEDGYYAIAEREGGGFEAFSIPQLWATPVPIGRAPTRRPDLRRTLTAAARCLTAMSLARAALLAVAPMKVTNHRVLRFFGFTPVSPTAKACVDAPLGDWLRYFWRWHITREARKF